MSGNCIDHNTLGPYMHAAFYVVVAKRCRTSKKWGRTIGEVERVRVRGRGLGRGLYPSKKI